MTRSAVAVDAEASRFSNLTTARQLFAEWADLAREGLAERALRRRRTSVIVKAVRSAAENADDVMLKLALWRSAKATSSGRTPVDALLRSALNDLSALS